MGALLWYYWNMTNYTYDELFQRNIGVFTQEQQDKIRNLKVAIAGAGGLGGPVAYNIARLGVGSIKIADPDKFEVSNINRQFGAYVDTVGEFKTDAISNELKRINPELDVKTWNNGINAENIDEFLEGVDLVIDGIDFFEVEVELLLHKKCRDKGLWIFTSQAAAEILTFTSFDPKGTALVEKLDMENFNIRNLISVFFPKLPKIATEEALSELKTGSDVHISSHATPPPFGGALLTEQVITKVIFNKSVTVFPEIMFIDLSVPEIGYS